MNLRGLLLVLAAAGAAGPVAADNEPWSAMPEGQGRRETFGVCSACHSMKIVEQQGMTRTQWAETLDYMVEEHGMAPLGGELLGRILDYLAMAYPPDRPNWRPEDRY